MRFGFFAGPTLSVKVFPDLETLPYDGFSAHPDITSARLATLARAAARAPQGVWLVADRHAAAAPGAPQLHRGLLTQSARRRDPRLRSAARATGIGRICRRHAGRRARRIRGARLVDRRVSDGLGHPLSNRHAGSRCRQHSPLRSGHAALAWTNWIAFSCCRRARRR